ncbi:MAG TPA: amino acid ABC transporter permease [Micromonospora sp.]|nr:amino acid ABC transporter permease [Micromonospora sp.]
MSFDWQIFLNMVTSATFAQGAGIAVVVTVISAAIATVAGLFLALARNSRYSVLRQSSVVYIFVGRAIPTLLWLLLVWNALPQVIPALRSEWFSPFLAAIVALSLSEAAYMAEIIRGGIMSVEDGQREAGRALGLMPHKVFAKIVWPQAVRVFLPTAGNEFISLLKLTSLASVISLQELLTVAGHKVSATYRFAEAYAAAAVWYLVIVSVFMLIQNQIERNMRWKSAARPRGQRLPRRRSGVAAIERRMTDA